MFESFWFDDPVFILALLLQHVHSEAPEIL
jgi:hypothetical protein